MFDLEKGIKNWRKSLHKNKSFEDGYIEELESHFRDLIEEKIKKGRSEEEALNEAASKIGNLKSINKEYSKAYSPDYKMSNSWYRELFIPALFFNYIKIAIRGFNKNRGYSFINISGLAIGMAVIFFAALFINYETSFDKQFKDNDRVYRVVKDFVFEDGIIPDATTPPALTQALKNEIPEIETALKILPAWGAKYLMSYGENKFYEEKILQADSNFFEIFNAETISGNINNALEQNNAVIITESIAKKYFGSKNPISKTLHVEIGTKKTDRVIKAVIKDLPENTHFEFDFLIPIDKNTSNTWGRYNYYTYIKLKENVSAVSLDSKIQKVFKKNVPERNHKYYTQKLTDIHLYSNLKWELKNNGSIQQVYVFSTIALFVLLIAGINYVNLSTAKSASRSKEVGLRKVNGAPRHLLIKQFLIESIVTAMISLLISGLILFATLPYLNSLLNINLVLFSKENIGLIFLMFGFTIFTGALAGVYPAIYLSGFQPVDILKGLQNKKGGIVWLRRGLVIVQFTISAILITGTFIIEDQLEFINNYDLGFEKEQVVVLPNTRALNNFEAFKNELKQTPGIDNVALSSDIIGKLNWTRGLRKKGAENDVLTNFQFVDYDFFNVMKIKIVEGRFFSQEFPSDYENGIVISQNAVKELGLEEPVIGKQIVWAENQDTTYYVDVVGVVKDFNFASLHQEIKPFGFVMGSEQLNCALIKLKTKNYKETLSYLEKIWDKYFPQKPFEYFFFDESFDELHQADIKFGKIFNVLTAIAIFIACLGLFALTAYTVEKKTKEIGIRKVLGASSRSIIFMLSWDVLKLVFVSNLLAWPATYLLMDNWLRDFAYRTNLSFYVFFFSTLLVVLMSLITISAQSLKASLSNPVKSLRSE